METITITPEVTYNLSFEAYTCQDYETDQIEFDFIPLFSQN